MCFENVQCMEQSHQLLLLLENTSSIIGHVSETYALFARDGTLPEHQVESAVSVLCRPRHETLRQDRTVSRKQKRATS